MSTNTETIAISTGDHKMAALFFDKIWPLHSMDSVPDEIQDINVSIPAEPDDVVMKTIGDWIMSVSKSPKDSVTFSARAAVLMHALAKDERYRDFLGSEFPPHDPMAPFRNLTASVLYQLMLGNNMNVVPILGSKPLQEKLANLNPIIEASPDLQEAKPALEINIKNFRLICGDNAEWTQVKEVRADKESLRKIRNLRVLFREKYKEKDAAFIKDDIDRRIDEYEQACEKHGFELLQSGFSSLLDPKSLLGISSLAAATAVIGGPAVITACAVGGAVLHTSKLAIELIANHWKFKQNQRNNEVAYVIEAKKHITDLTPSASQE